MPRKASLRRLDSRRSRASSSAIFCDSTSISTWCAVDRSFSFCLFYYFFFFLFYFLSIFIFIFILLIFYFLFNYDGILFMMLGSGFSGLVMGLGLRGWGSGVGASLGFGVMNLGLRVDGFASAIHLSNSTARQKILR